MSTGWEDRAESWIGWARTPDHDDYWRFRDSFFELVPTPGRRTLEIGCGEGRVCRDLHDRGHDVVGLDAAPSLIAAAASADPNSEYIVGDAAALPFADDSFDLVVAYNSLMDVEDMPAAIAEGARVLAPGGHFCACITHPFRDAGRFESRDPGAPFIVTGTYFTEGTYEYAAERNSLSLELAFRTYPLSSYTAALEAAGFLLESLRELAGSDNRDTRIPQFLFWRALKP